MKLVFAEKYKELATALGDVEFRIYLLQQEKNKITEDIEMLNKLAGFAKQSEQNETDQVLDKKA
jgi:hypothetical protein